MIALAFATVALSKSASKKEKRGVAVLGPSSYDFFGVAPIFSAGSWPSTSFGSSSWSPSGVPDIPLTQVQIQATHDVAVQVCWINGGPNYAEQLIVCEIFLFLFYFLFYA